MKSYYFLLLIPFLFFNCSAEKEDSLTYATYTYTEEEEPPVSVDVLEVSEDALVPGIRASGIIEGINEITVISETQGIIETLEFDLGSYVKKGDILLSVDNTIAGINRDKAKLELDSAYIDLQSIKKFYNSGSTSQAEYIKAESVYSTRKAQYETALKTYEDCTIRSPISGYVALKSQGVSVGSYISQGNPVTRIVDNNSFLLNIAVGERQVPLIKKGQKAEVTIPTLDKTVKALVSAVAGGSNRDTGSFQVVITWKNDGTTTLKSGMSASVEIDTTDSDPVIIIPAIAITEREGKDYVFVALDNRAEAVEVVTGDSFGDRLEVASGLKTGDSLIITRVNTLKPGQNIITRNQGKSGDWR